jgi:hypothetical protein
MGWDRISELKVEKSGSVTDKCELWTRGGLNGVTIYVDDKAIAIPKEVLLELVAAEFLRTQISRFEQMDTEQAIAAMMGESR